MATNDALKYASYHYDATQGLTPKEDPTLAIQPEEPFFIDPDETLSKKDLLKSQYLNPIRDYMVARKGVDYNDVQDEQLVDDFVTNMRFFNANSISTAGELGFIQRSDDVTKDKARKAYQIYEQLGNVFQNDGIAGAVSGIGDYVFAAATDPTNYIGALTGGLARAGAAGAQIGGKEAIKLAVRQAGMKAAQSGATRQAAEEAAKRAGMKAGEIAMQKGFYKPTQDLAYKEVYSRVSKAGRKAFAEKAMKETQEELFEAAGSKALKATVLLDSAAALAQDYGVQTTLLEAGAQEEYSALQGGASLFLGGVAGGAQLAGRKLKKTFGTGLDEVKEVDLDNLANNIIDEHMGKFTKKDVDRAKKTILTEIDDWNKKVAAGQQIGGGMPAELIRNIMLGKPKDGGGYEGGIAKIYKEKGIKVGRERHLSDLATNLMRFMPDEDVEAINKELAKFAGINFGDVGMTRATLGDLVSKEINNAGKVLNVQSQLRKMLDAGTVAGSRMISNQLDNIVEADEQAKKLVEEGLASRKYAWGQSIWKRMLVSSPATTALNVAGYAQFAAGQTLADLFNGTAHMTIAAMKATYDPKGAAEMARRGRAYYSVLGTRARMMVDPYTTYNSYRKLLSENQDLEKVLLDTVSGIEGRGTRYAMDPESKLFKYGEYMATAANATSGVSIQDSFTKSQMFMAEIDKYLRLNKNMTLKEAMDSADETILDESVMGGALDTTLKSVFSKDYRKLGEDGVIGGEVLGGAAKMVEYISNMPGFGTILPFGRFMTNVVGTAVQWSPLASPELFRKMYRATWRGEGWDVTDNEILARMTVGTSAALLAMQYDQSRREKGLGVYEVDVGGGTIIDAQNTYPFSAFLAVGRALNLKRNGEELPPELQTEALLQLGVGQIAKDTQFGNDLVNLADVLMNFGEGGERGANPVDAFAKVAGNITAGFTRPVDAYNKILGFAMGTDAKKDVRQAEGMNLFTQTASKYVDNIFEILGDRVNESVTGEELRTATREGTQYEENPFAKVFGLTIKQGRTSTEKAYSMAEMMPWTANERTKLPAYDKAFNTVIAPQLERATSQLMKDKQFKEADLNGKRRMLNNVVNTMRTQYRNAMLQGYGGDENAKLRMTVKAQGAYNKDVRKEALRLMKERYGIDGDIEDFSFRELDIFMQYAEMINDVYSEVGKAYGKN